MEHRVLIAGFGGQGVLFTGELLATAGMLEDKHVSWMPAYGPEMRGGTANCGVNIADSSISSPIVSEPTALIAMNGPSLEKYEHIVAPGGLVIINSSLTDNKTGNRELKTLYLPANDLALGLGKVQVAGNIMLGALLGLTDMVGLKTAIAALEQLFAQKSALIPVNRAALELGYERARQN